MSTQTISARSSNEIGHTQILSRDISEEDEKIKECADRYWDQYSRIVSRQPWDSYQYLLRAASKYEEMSPSIIKLRELSATYRALGEVAVEIRRIKREAHSMCTMCCLANMIACITLPCSVIYCVKWAWCTKWVDNATTDGYIKKAETLANQLIRVVKESHGINMNTDKSTIPEQARIDISYGYSQLAYIASINDGWEGANDVVKTRSVSTAVAHLQAAVEWNPDNQNYREQLTRLQGVLNSPTVNVVVYRS